MSPEGLVTILEYSDTANPFSAVGGTTQDFEYDGAVRPLLQRSSNGETLSFKYDRKGQLIEVRDSEGISGTYEYDLNGNITRVIGREGGITEMDYDSSNQVIRETKILTNDDNYDDDLVTAITDDLAGRITSVTDPLARTIAYEYDKDNR